MSGVDPSPVATSKSSGIVVPLVWKDGRYERTYVPPVARFFTGDARVRSTLSWHQVHLPCLRATVHMLDMCVRVAFGEHQEGSSPSFVFPTF